VKIKHAHAGKSNYCGDIFDTIGIVFPISFHWYYIYY